MRHRLWAIAIGLGLCISRGGGIPHKAIATTPFHPIANPSLALSATEASSARNDAIHLGEANAVIASHDAADFAVENILEFRTRWPLILGYVLGIGAIAVALQQYRARCRWRRVECARQAFLAFQSKPEVQNVMSILDFEEYRTQYFTDLITGEIKSFQATDARLRRSLREHDAMVKIKIALQSIEKNHGLTYTTPTGKPESIDLEICRQYKDNEFPIEITLRDWFDVFLMGLEEIEAMIQGGLFTARDVKPFIFYWIQVIADRTVRRKGGASFYDSLFYYIHYSGYSGVEALFERYSYKVLPPPYTPHDFDKDAEVKALTFANNTLYRALCCAKASMLVYEDDRYMADIATLWLKDTPTYDYRRESNEQFLAGIIHEWQAERSPILVNLQTRFKAFEIKETDTQAFLFRNDLDIILVFRGTEKFEDWKTNLSLTLQRFRADAPQKSVPESSPTPVGKVHRGFFNALKSIEDDIIDTLKEWEQQIQPAKSQSEQSGQPSNPSSLSAPHQERPKIWVTGHSLGGALAALAAVSLKCRGFNIAGLYTFGQPRVGDWAFSKAALDTLNHPHPIPVERYANNNDIVPLIPPGFVPWQPTRVYGHFGQFRYFDSRGKLQPKSFLGQRLADRVWGFFSALLTTGPDAVSDHFMEFYIANLQRAIAKEREHVKTQDSDP